MADKGIIFSAPMVRALLEGRKTQTRRLLTLRGYREFSQFGPCDTEGYDWHFRRADGCWCEFRAGDLPLPYAVGDRLYVRENFQLLSFGDYAVTKTQPADVRFAATDPLADSDKDVRGYTWRPCIHMPRWASRLWVSLTDVRVQRVQDIRSTDAEAEGIERDIGFPRRWRNYVGTTPLAAPEWGFSSLWDSLHTRDGERWQDNPWIVAISFDVHHGNIDAVPN